MRGNPGPQEARLSSLGPDVAILNVFYSAIADWCINYMINMTAMMHAGMKNVCFAVIQKNRRCECEIFASAVS